MGPKLTPSDGATHELTHENRVYDLLDRARLDEVGREHKTLRVVAHLSDDVGIKYCTPSNKGGISIRSNEEEVARSKVTAARPATHVRVNGY